MTKQAGSVGERNKHSAVGLPSNVKAAHVVANLEQDGQQRRAGTRMGLDVSARGHPLLAGTKGSRPNLKMGPAT